MLAAAVHSRTIAPAPKRGTVGLLCLPILPMVILGFGGLERLAAPAPDPNAARAAALSAIFQHPDDVSARVRFAHLVSPAEAVPHLKAALRHCPQDDSLLRQLGDAYRDSQSFEPAADCYRKALHGGSDDPGLLYELGSALLRTGRPSNAAEALDALQRASKQAPTDTETMVLIGDAFLALHRENDARQIWQKAIEVDPDGTSATKAWIRLTRQAGGRVKMQSLEDSELHPSI